METSVRQRPPNRRSGLRVTLGAAPHLVQMATGEFKDGTLGEIFLDSSKEGTFSRAMLNAFAMAISLGLQHGIPLATFAHTFRDFKMEPDVIRQIFVELETFYGEKQ